MAAAATTPRHSRTHLLPHTHAPPAPALLQFNLTILTVQCAGLCLALLLPLKHAGAHHGLAFPWLTASGWPEVVQECTQAEALARLGTSRPCTHVNHTAVGDMGFPNLTFSARCSYPGYVFDNGQPLCVTSGFEWAGSWRVHGL